MIAVHRKEDAVQQAVKEKEQVMAAERERLVDIHRAETAALLEGAMREAEERLAAAKRKNKRKRNSLTSSYESIHRTLEEEHTEAVRLMAAQHAAEMADTQAQSRDLRLDDSKEQMAAAKEKRRIKNAARNQQHREAMEVLVAQHDEALRQIDALHQQQMATSRRGALEALKQEHQDAVDALTAEHNVAMAQAAALLESMKMEQLEQMAVVEIVAEAERLKEHIAELECERAEAIREKDDAVKQAVDEKEKTMISERDRLLDTLATQHNAAMAESEELMKTVKGDAEKQLAAAKKKRKKKRNALDSCYDIIQSTMEWEHKEAMDELIAQHKDEMDQAERQAQAQIVDLRAALESANEARAEQAKQDSQLVGRQYQWHRQVTQLAPI